jgi:hypothetical protein
MSTNKHESKTWHLFVCIRVHSWLKGFSVFSFSILLSACGYVGNPLPPTLDIPQAISDMRVAEYGEKLLVEFTVPPQTTEGLPLKSIRSLDLRIGTAPTPWNENAWAAAANHVDCSATKPGPVTCWATPQDVAGWIGKEVIIRARTTGPKGKPSEWSRVKTLPVQPPLAAPAELRVLNEPRGMSLTWKSPANHFRIFRSVGDGSPEMKGEASEPTYLDLDIEFGTRYQYYVQAVAGEYQQSETAPSQPMLRADDFIPAVPTGLTAEQSASAIELSWDRNTDARFQGYNVYRSVNGAPLEKIASLLTAPAYSDRQIETGKQYVYRIAAVGLNNRESEQSAPTTVTAQ